MNGIDREGGQGKNIMNGRDREGRGGGRARIS